MRLRNTPDALAIFLIVFVTSVPFFLDLANRNPAYLRDYRLNLNPDARHYVQLGRNLFLKGVYSRQQGEPYQPDMLRTPVYPVVAGSLDVMLGPGLLYAFQGICRAATSLTVYGFCARRFGRPVGLLAGVLVSVDLMLAVLAMEAMSEILFNVFATLAVLLWLQVLSEPRKGLGSVAASIALGILVGLATLIRPASLYLPLVLAIAGILCSRPGVRQLILRRAAVMFAVSVATILPWVVRNAIVFGVPRLTTADSINLVYFAGAGAYAVEFGIPLEETQQRIANEYDLATLFESNNDWVGNRGVKLLDRQQRTAIPKILAKHPRSLIKATFIGLAKSTMAHNVDVYANMSSRKWEPPGVDKLASHQYSRFFKLLFLNDPLLVFLCIWEILYAGIIGVLSIFGAVAGLRSADLRRPILYLLLIAAYYVATIAVVGLDAYSRHRAMLVPIQCVLAAVAIERWRRRAPTDESTQIPTHVNPAEFCEV